MALPFELFFYEILPNMTYSQMVEMVEICDCKGFKNNQIVDYLVPKIEEFDEIFEKTLNSFKYDKVINQLINYNYNF